jgi:hypothetical protein
MLCYHEWKHRFAVEHSGALIITCYCAKCGKIKRPERYAPADGDEIVEEKRDG